MKKELSPMEKTLAFSALKNRFFIMVQVGAIMILMTSTAPFYAAHAIPAIIITIISILFDKWEGAQIIHRRIIIITILALCFWIAANTVMQWFPVPPEVTEVRFPPITVTPKITLTMGFMGHIIALIGAVEALSGLKLLKE